MISLQGRPPVMILGKKKKGVFPGPGGGKTIERRVEGGRKTDAHPNKKSPTNSFSKKKKKGVPLRRKKNEVTKLKEVYTQRGNGVLLVACDKKRGQASDMGKKGGGLNLGQKEKKENWFRAKNFAWSPRCSVGKKKRKVKPKKSDGDLFFEQEKTRGREIHDEKDVSNRKRNIHRDWTKKKKNPSFLLEKKSFVWREERKDVNWEKGKGCLIQKKVEPFSERQHKTGKEETGKFWGGGKKYRRKFEEFRSPERMNFLLEKGEKGMEIQRGEKSENCP